MLNQPNPRPEAHPGEPSPSSHPEPVPLVSDADLVNPLLTAADVMNDGPRTCSPSSSVVEASLIFRDADCGFIPVVDDGRPVGVLTDRDVALAVADRDGDLTAVMVGDLMTRDVVAIGKTAPLLEVFEKLGKEGVRRLLVIGHKGLQEGVISWTDLIPHVSERALGRLVGRIVENR
jgi:CBS domain-containing protein